MVYYQLTLKDIVILCESNRYGWGDYSVFLVMNNEVGELLQPSFGGAIKIKDDVQWSAENVLTGPEHYYQTMVDRWVVIHGMAIFSNIVLLYTPLKFGGI